MNRLKRTMVMAVCLVLLAPVALRAQTYENMWKQVEKAQADDLPRQVLAESESIMQKARKEKNFAWQMKAWVTIVTAKMSLDPDSFDISKLPEIHPDGIGEEAIYHAVMATAYQAAMRTSTVVNDAETLTEYTARRDEHFAKMMENSDKLADADIEPYLPLMTKGDDSQLFGHDLLSVFVRFNTQHNPLLDNKSRTKLYADAAQTYKQRGNMEAYTLMQLESIKSGMDYAPEGIKKFGEAMRALLKESENLNAGADVAMELVIQSQAFADNDERVTFARWAAKTFARSKLVNAFTNIEKAIMQPTCQILVGDYEHALVAGLPAHITLKYNNMDAVEMEVRAFNGLDSRHRPKTDGRLIDRRTHTFATTPDISMRREKHLPYHGEEADSIILPAGKYVVVCRNGKTEAVERLDITSLTIFTYNLPDDKVRVAVVNNITGRPASGAKVSYSTDSGKTFTDVQTDQRGEVTLKATQRMMVKASIPGTDDETSAISLYNVRYDDIQKTNIKTRLFTDRAIYRPGQTLHLSGIVFEQKGDYTHTLAGIEHEFTLYDANGEEVARQTARSNEWGVVESDFLLPVGRMPGSYRIRTGGTSKGFMVEEYKRPTFTVETREATSPEGEREYTFGDTLVVEAVVKTYSGVPVQGAKVSYKTYRRIGAWKEFVYRPWDETGQGETTTDADGVAHVTLRLNGEDIPHDAKAGYKVEFDVTSTAGETHSESFQTTISKQGFDLVVKTKAEAYDLAHPDDIVIKAENAGGKPLDIKGRYVIKHTNKQAEFWRNVTDDDEKDEPAVWEADFESGKPFHMPQLEAGYYMICAYATDSRGNTITGKERLTVFNSDNATPILGKRQGERNTYTEPMFHFDVIRFSPTKPAVLYVAPADDDVSLNYAIISDKAVIERHTVVIGRELRKLTIPYRPEYGDGVTVVLYYARDGKTYIEQQPIYLANPDKELKLEWKSFRDRLYPGQDEEWILTVKDKNGKTVDGASLMATMYDSSLDALYPHSWHLDLVFPRRIHPLRSQRLQPNHGVQFFLSQDITQQNIGTRAWDELTTYIQGGYGRRLMRLAGGLPVMAMAKASNNVDMAEFEEGLQITDVDEALQGRIAGLDISEESPAIETDAANGSKDHNVQPRTNFAETAFFASHILTDQNGDAHISFTLPESLTEWQLLALAHTKDMDYGQISAKAVARKDFMVQPNMPRFVREGDKASISTSVINRTTQAITADIHFRLLDAETMTEVYAARKTVEVGAEKTEAVAFSFDVSDRYSMLVCEITGQSTTFSDGERQYLPVLTSKRYVTETIPFYIMAGETSKSVDIHTLFNNNSATATGRRMTLEFTQNPEWTVIEALEAVKLPKNNDAPDLAAALYSNVTAARLAQSVPGLGKALEQTAPATSDLDAADDHLRDIISQESPWMRDAHKEARQRAELIDFFNPALIATRTDQARDRLLALQREDGAWSWFEGMDGNYYITLSVCEMLAMLDDEQTHEALIQGMRYLDAKELEWYKEAKLRKQDIVPGETTLHYLYVSSLVAGRKVSSEVSAMREAYMKVLAKSSSKLSIYGKANGANILRAFNHTKQANTLLRSAVEYTVEKAGMGRYYATDRALYSWRDYRLPTHLAAMRAIRLSDRSDRDRLLADMQLWLIRQKQVQMWDNPMNTIAAVDFMMGSSDGSRISPMRATHFDIDGKTIDTPVDTTRFLARQLGYVKENIPVADGHSMTTLNIAQATTPATSPADASHIAFGAVYAGCLDNLSAMQSGTSGELSISRKYMKDGKEFDPSATTLSVGDKVTVRLIIRADRDMDFLQVRTGHPACLEPVSQLSGYRWMNGRGGYVSMHDASIDIFFDHFTRGTTTYDIDFHVTRTGTYLADIATLQCAYSPEFSAHTGAETLTVSK